MNYLWLLLFLCIGLSISLTNFSCAWDLEDVTAPNMYKQIKQIKSYRFWGYVALVLSGIFGISFLLSFGQWLFVKPQNVISTEIIYSYPMDKEKPISISINEEGFFEGNAQYSINFTSTSNELISATLREYSCEIVPSEEYKMEKVSYVKKDPILCDIVRWISGKPFLFCKTTSEITYLYVPAEVIQKEVTITY